MTDEDENQKTTKWPNCDNVTKAHRKIIGMSHPGDTILFYFIGHGNRQMENTKLPNDTGFMEYLVMADSTVMTGIF